MHQLTAYYSLMLSTNVSQITSFDWKRANVFPQPIHNTSPTAVKCTDIPKFARQRK